MPIKVPAIREFAIDDKPWRIDWLGAIERNDNISEPTIQVILSSEDGIQRKVCNIGVGQLPFLRIGSNWHGGNLLSKVEGMQLNLPNIVISDETISTVRSDHQLSKNRYLIPPFSHKVGSQGMGTQCLSIAYGGDPHGIVLPMPEAIRFYYAGSSDLAHAAFNGMYRHDRSKLINPELSGFFDEDRRCLLRLRRWLADEDGWTIGRVLHNPLAANGAYRIHDSLMRTSTNRKPKFPECSLPFQGTVRWIARGLRIPNPDGGSPRHLIFELLKCSSAFPFDLLEVTRDNDGAQANPETDIPQAEKKSAWATPRKAANLGDQPLQSLTPPHGYTQQIEIPLINERFDVLTDKEIIRNPKDFSNYRSTGLKPLAAQDSSSLSTGAGTSGETGTAPAEVTNRRERQKGLQASLSILPDVTRSLNTIKGVIAVLRGNNNDPYLIPLTAPAKHWQWSYLDSRTKIFRRAMAINIFYKRRHFCFIEFEHRPKSDNKTAGLVASNVGIPINEYIFNNILELIATTKGMWEMKIFLREKLMCWPVRHTWPDQEGCAKVIVAKIEEAIAIESQVS